MRIDDIVIITQCSEDETWLEGTLDGHTGWFPSNYVHLLDENGQQQQSNGEPQSLDEQPRNSKNKQPEPTEENTRIRVKHEKLE